MLPTDSMLVVSLLVLLVGIVLTTRQLKRRLRELARGTHRVVEETADLACQALFLGGLALMGLSQVTYHVINRSLSADPWLSLTGSTLTLVLFGISLGRLLMRWQLRYILAELNTEAVQIPSITENAIGEAPR